MGFRLLCFTLVFASASAEAEPLRFKTEHPQADSGSLRWFADLLTGIEVTGFVGQAYLSSGVRTEAGRTFRLTNPNAEYSGYDISLLDAARKSGIGFGLDAGFFRQRATVAGFRESLPRGSAGCRTAPEPTECQQPDRYDIRLWSAYLGPELFAALVAGSRHLEIFGLVSVAVRAVEYRAVSASAGEIRVKDDGPVALRSGTTGLTIGVTLPVLHISGRIGVDFEHYFRFRYPQPLEFEGPVAYDEQQEALVRQRLWVDDTRVNSIAFSASAGVLF